MDSKTINAMIPIEKWIMTEVENVEKTFKPGKCDVHGANDSVITMPSTLYPYIKPEREHDQICKTCLLLFSNQILSGIQTRLAEIESGFENKCDCGLCVDAKRLHQRIKETGRMDLPGEAEILGYSDADRVKDQETTQALRSARKTESTGLSLDPRTRALWT